MQYPTVSLNAMQGFLAEVVIEGQMADQPQPLLRGSGDDFLDKNKKKLRDIQERLSKEMAAADKKTIPDEVEGRFSVELFSALHNLPVEILTDRDFWRYLSCSYFFDFIIWRDRRGDKLPAHASFGASSKSISFDCVPYRMFNRGLLNYLMTGNHDDDSYSRIAGTDVWRSHILRVKTSFAPELVRSYIEKLEAKKLPTDLVRPLAKRIRRDRSNILFEVLDGDQTSLFFERDYNTEAKLHGK